ncbi:MAG: hypothetical protein ACU4F9_06085 [Arcticibacter sp.]
MNFLLGINDDLLRQVGPVEKSGYRLVNYLFIAVSLLSLIANGYFGYLLIRTWWGSLLISSLMGFIQFSILRISLITLMTKSLVDNEMPKSDSPETIKVRLLTRVNGMMNLSTILRFVFTGLVAIAISVPLSIIFLHTEAIKEEQLYRDKITQMVNTELSEITIESMHINEAYYPLVILKFCSSKSAYQFLVLIFILAVYSPLIVLGRLRFNNNNKYADLCKESMRKEVIIDYQETLEQSQHVLFQKFPDFKTRLEDLTPFADMPFKQEKKINFKRTFGTSEEFQQFIRTL